METQLEWPTINATSTILEAELEKMGYVLEHQGRSGFARRNYFEVKTQDGVLSPETVAKIEKDLEQAKRTVRSIKQRNFDEYFDSQSTDGAKTFALVETGYDYDLTRIIDDEKYERVAQIRIACTSDHRQGIDHTYLELLIHKDRMQKDKRGKPIVFEVPQKMIGLIIGSGGSKIKALQQKYAKRFVVVRDPKEIAEEKRRQEEARIREHEYALSSLRNKIMYSMGDDFISADDEKIATSMVEYIINNKDQLTVQPTPDEMQQMKEKLIAERDDRIARENQRKAEEIAYQKRLEAERLAEQKRQEEEKVKQLTQTLKDHVQNWADEHNGAVISNVEFMKFVQENFAEDTMAQKFLGSLQKEFLLKLEEERAVYLRAQEADRNFESVAKKEFAAFFADDVATGGHGESFFNVVGRARRNSAYFGISERIERRLHIYDDLRRPLEDRLIDPRPKEERWGSYLDERSKFYDRVVAYQENSSYEENFEDYAQKQREEREAKPAPEVEPTLENLAAIWGAKLKNDGK